MLHKVIGIALILLLVVSAGRFTVEGSRLLRDPMPVAGAVGDHRELPQFTAEVLSPSAVFNVGRVHLDDLDHVLVLLFDPDCGPCDMNMSNWVDLLASDALADTDVIALSLAGREGVVDYWRPLNRRVAVAAADSATLVGADLITTPTTLLLRNGQVEFEFHGIFNSQARKALLDRL